MSQEEIQFVGENNVGVCRKVIDEQKPDIVFVWNLYFLNKNFIEFLITSEEKVVFFLSDNWLASSFNVDFVVDYFDKLSAPRLKKDRLVSFFKRSLSGSKMTACQIGQRAIFSSDYMREFYGLAGLSFTESTTIYNGINFSNIDVGKIVPRGGLSNNGEVKLLFAGRIVHIKGVHVLLESLKLLISKYGVNNFRLTIMGDVSDKDYYQYLEGRIRDLGLEEFVTIKAPVKEEDLCEEFQKYDIHIFPSLYEPFSLTLIYALACGIPSVVSKAGGNEEIAIDNETALLYDPFDTKGLADRILKLINDGDLRNRLSQNSQVFAKRFNMEGMVDSIEKYFIDLK